MKTRLSDRRAKKGQASMLSEKEMPAYLVTLVRKDWKPLFALIPRVQAKKGFGKWRFPKKEDGAFILPYCDPGSTEQKFLEVVYRMRLVIAFDWGKWDKGRKLEKKDPSGLDLLTLLKLMTTYVRADRFCEGALHSAMKNGVMLGILKAIRLRVEESSGP